MPSLTEVREGGGGGRGDGGGEGPGGKWPYIGPRARTISCNRAG
jgi:hypothetical protein